MATLQTILKLGVTPSLDKDFQVRIRLANAIAVFSVPLCLIAAIIGIIRVDVGIMWSFLVSALFYASIPMVNKIGYFNLSRITLSLVPYVLIILPTMLSSEITLGHIFSYSYAFIGLVFVPALLFDANTEKVKFYSLIFIQLLCVLSFDLIMLNSASEASKEIFMADIAQIKLAQFILVAFIVGVSALFQNRNKIGE